MQDRPSQRRLPPLYSQQAWLVRLRWLAGTAVAAGGLLDELYLDWYARGWAITAVGLVILLYNLGLHLLLRAERPRPPSQHRLRILAWMQILPDLSALTALTLWTGGYASSLLSFYVFHMVFASLLLPRAMAFAVAGVAVVMVELALWIDHLNPRTRHDLTIGVGWALTLLATVYLANKITRSLRMSQRRLKSRNRRIQALARRLRAQQQALLQQEKMVAMGQMAAGVAHEIANPLASMDGLLQLLARQPEKISAENLARLREQVARINAIVRQLTTFAHPGQGAWEDASLNEVATRALAVLRFDRRLQGVNVEQQLAPDLPRVKMLPAALEQVVINLAINAVDAMEGASAPRLLLRTAADADTVRLEITDNGHGIDPAIAQRILEPFFTTKPVGKGTGLGLSISYSLVQKHGGKLEVTSVPGQGASFVIALPRAGPEAPTGS